MRKQQEQFTGRYTTDELGKGLQEFAMSMNKQEKKTMARTYNGTLHEKNVNNMQDYYEVSKKNKYRKCMVTIDDKRKKGKTE